MVHDGYMFHASGRVVDLGVGADLELLLAVPAGCYPHIQKIVFHLEGAPMDVAVYEGTTTSADGTAVTTKNTNRNSALTPDAVLTHTPTITGDGALMHDRYIPTAGKDVGQLAGSLFEEWILAADTKYLIRLSNDTGAIADLSYEVLWYEIGPDSENGAA
jgi:hypothetical protein